MMKKKIDWKTILIAVAFSMVACSFISLKGLLSKIKLAGGTAAETMEGLE